MDFNITGCKLFSQNELAMSEHTIKIGNKTHAFISTYDPQDPPFVTLNLDKQTIKVFQNETTRTLCFTCGKTIDDCYKQCYRCMCVSTGRRVN